jgi:pectate lyase
VEASTSYRFANETQIVNNLLIVMLKNISTTRNVPIDSLMDTQTEVKIVTLDKDSKNIWVKQTYLAMGNL